MMYKAALASLDCAVREERDGFSGALPADTSEA
jgi:hypothetical protein